MKDAKIEGFFTNHSARRTGGTRLFRAGVDRKLVKEAMGHSSDAVDKYQITSDEQRELMSHIIAGNPGQSNVTVSPKHSDVINTSVTVTDKEGSTNCKTHENVISNANVGGLVNEIIEKNSKSGKTVIKISIEITKE